MSAIDIKARNKMLIIKGILAEKCGLTPELYDELSRELGEFMMIISRDKSDGKKQVDTESNCNLQNVVCSCGGGNGANHPVGVGGCFRYHVTDPNEIPRNRRRWYNTEWWDEPVWIWDIGDSWVTEYTLYHQRLYAQDKNGNWTRPKSKDSVNSLCGDW